jgi:hypothetical protein
VLPYVINKLNNNWCIDIESLVIDNNVIMNQNQIANIFNNYFSSVGWVAQSVTGYGLDGPGIESRWGRDFSHTSRLALGPTQPPV